MNKYEIRTENKKTAIIQSALTLFKQKGFIAVSIKEIAAMANVSQVSIYNYFGSKEALVGECVTLFMHDIVEKAQNLLAKDMDFKTKLNSAIALCNSDISTSLSSFLSHEALKDSTMIELIIANINKEKLKIYCNYIELGKQEGAIDPSIETSTILLFLESINTIGSNMEINSNLLDKQIQLQKLFLYGILGK